MRTLGMIGGTSWHSTIEYYRLLNHRIGEKLGTHLNPPLILHSIDVSVMRTHDPEKIKAKYLDVSEKLQAAGAEAIIICANTPHLTYPYVQPKIEIPILHIAEATGQEAKKQNISTLGLLGTKPTMTGRFIPDVLEEKFGIQTVVPSEDHIEKPHQFIADELTQGKFTNEALTYFTERIEELKSNGAEGIILGCTELPILFKDAESELPLMDTTSLHVDMAIDFILSDT